MEGVAWHQVAMEKVSWCHVAMESVITSGSYRESVMASKVAMEKVSWCGMVIDCYDARSWLWRVFQFCCVWIMYGLLVRKHLLSTNILSDRLYLSMAYYYQWFRLNYHCAKHDQGARILCHVAQQPICSHLLNLASWSPKLSGRKVCRLTGVRDPLVRSHVKYLTWLF